MSNDVNCAMFGVKMGVRKGSKIERPRKAAHVELTLLLDAAGQHPHLLADLIVGRVYYQGINTAAAIRSAQNSAAARSQRRKG